MTRAAGVGANQRLRSAKNRRGGQTAPTSALRASQFSARFLVAPLLGMTRCRRSARSGEGKVDAAGVVEAVGGFEVDVGERDASRPRTGKDPKRLPDQGVVADFRLMAVAI